jgi:predicted Ser/Thr protein kinase
MLDIISLVKDKDIYIMEIIVTENQFKKLLNLNEMGPGDLHYKNIVSHYIDGSPSEKLKIANAIKKITMVKHKKVNLDTIKHDLLGLHHDEIEEVEKDLGIYDL